MADPRAGWPGARRRDVVRDIAERHQAATALAQAQDRFRSAFEDSPVGMVMLDLDFRYTQLNDAFCRMLGYTRARAIRTIAEQDDSDAGSGTTAFEINLSGASIGNPTLLEHIEQQLAKFSVDPARVIFEITETAALSSVTSANEFAERLSQIGCRFALDDFGARFGSFYYLKHLHFDLIKIDGEFVRNCVTSRTERLLIAAIVDIARGLAKQTIAEFVSDDETIVLLRELGSTTARDTTSDTPHHSHFGPEHPTSADLL